MHTWFHFFAKLLNVISVAVPIRSYNTETSTTQESPPPGERGQHTQQSCCSASQHYSPIDTQSNEEQYWQVFDQINPDDNDLAALLSQTSLHNSKSGVHPEAQ